MSTSKPSKLLPAASAVGLGVLGAVPLHAALVSPAGLAPGSPFVYIYETTATTTATSALASTYNTFAATDAANSGYSTYNGSSVTWDALVSTSSANASSLIANDSASFWTPSGVEIASSYANLFAGSLINPVSNVGSLVWTGSNASGGPGTYYGYKATTMGTSTGVAYGTGNLASSKWLNTNGDTSAAPSNTYPVYAFSNELTATAVPEPASLGMLGAAAGTLLIRRRRTA